MQRKIPGSPGKMELIVSFSGSPQKSPTFQNKAALLPPLSSQKSLVAGLRLFRSPRISSEALHSTQELGEGLALSSLKPGHSSGRTVPSALQSQNAPDGDCWYPDDLYSEVPGDAGSPRLSHQVALPTSSEQRTCFQEHGLRSLACVPGVLTSVGSASPRASSGMVGKLVTAARPTGVDGRPVTRQTPLQANRQKRSEDAFTRPSSIGGGPKMSHSLSGNRSVDEGRFYRGRGAAEGLHYPHEAVGGSPFQIQTEQCRRLRGQNSGLFREAPITTSDAVVSFRPEDLSRPPLDRPSADDVPPVSRSGSSCSRGSFTEAESVPDEARPTSQVPGDSSCRGAYSQITRGAVASGLPSVHVMHEGTGERQVSSKRQRQASPLLCSSVPLAQGGLVSDRTGDRPVQQPGPLRQKTLLGRAELTVQDERAVQRGHRGHATALRPKITVAEEHVYVPNSVLSEVEQRQEVVYEALKGKQCYRAFSAINQKEYDAKGKEPLSANCTANASAAQAVPFNDRMPGLSHRDPVLSPLNECMEQRAVSCTYPAPSPFSVFCPSPSGGVGAGGAARVSDNYSPRGGRIHREAAVQEGEEKKEREGRIGTGEVRNRAPGACSSRKEREGRSCLATQTKEILDSVDTLKSSSVNSSVPDERSAGIAEEAAAQVKEWRGAEHRLMTCGSCDDARLDGQTWGDSEWPILMPSQQNSQEPTSFGSFLAADERCREGIEQISRRYGAAEEEIAEIASEGPCQVNTSEERERGAFSQPPAFLLCSHFSASASGKSADLESIDVSHMDHQFSPEASPRQCRSQALSRSLLKESHGALGLRRALATPRVTAAVRQRETAEAEQETVEENDNKSEGREETTKKVLGWSGMVGQKEYKRRQEKLRLQAWRETFRSRSPLINSCRWSSTALRRAGKVGKATGGHQANAFPSPRTCMTLASPSWRPVKLSSQQVQRTSWNCQEGGSSKRGGDSAPEKALYAHHGKGNEKKERTGTPLTHAAEDWELRKRLSALQSSRGESMRSFVRLSASEERPQMVREASCSLSASPNGRGSEGDATEKEPVLSCSLRPQRRKSPQPLLKERTSSPQKVPRQGGGAEEDHRSLHREGRDSSELKPTSPEQTRSIRAAGFLSANEPASWIPAASLHTVKQLGPRSRGKERYRQPFESGSALYRGPFQAATVTEAAVSTPGTGHVSPISFPGPSFMAVVRPDVEDPVYASSHPSKHPWPGLSASYCHCPTPSFISRCSLPQVRCSPPPVHSQSPHPASSVKLREEVEISKISLKEKRDSDQSRQTLESGIRGAHGPPRNGSSATPNTVVRTLSQQTLCESMASSNWPSREQSLSCRRHHPESPHTLSAGHAPFGGSRGRRMSETCSSPTRCCQTPSPKVYCSPSLSRVSDRCSVFPLPFLSISPGHSPLPTSSASRSTSPLNREPPCSGGRAAGPALALTNASGRRKTSMTDKECRIEPLPMKESKRKGSTARALSKPVVKASEFLVLRQVSGGDSRPDASPVTLGLRQNPHGTPTPQRGQDPVVSSLQLKGRNNCTACFDGTDSEAAFEKRMKCPVPLDKSQGKEVMSVSKELDSCVCRPSPLQADPETERPEEEGRCSTPHFLAVRQTECAWRRRNSGRVHARAPAGRVAGGDRFQTIPEKFSGEADVFCASCSGKRPESRVGRITGEGEEYGCVSLQALCGSTRAVLKKLNRPSFEDSHASLKHSTRQGEESTVVPGTVSSQREDKRTCQRESVPSKPAPFPETLVRVVGHSGLGDGRLSYSLGDSLLPSSKAPPAKIVQEYRETDNIERACSERHALPGRTCEEETIHSKSKCTTVRMLTALLPQPSSRGSTSRGISDSGSLLSTTQEKSHYHRSGASLTSKPSNDAGEETGSLQALGIAPSRPQAPGQTQKRRGEEGNNKEVFRSAEEISCYAVRMRSQERTLVPARDTYYNEEREGNAEYFQGTAAAQGRYKEDVASCKEGRATRSPLGRPCTSSPGKDTLAKSRDSHLSSASKHGSKKTPTPVEAICFREDAEMEARTAPRKQSNRREETGRLTGGACQRSDVNSGGAGQTKGGRQSNHDGTGRKPEENDGVEQACPPSEEADRERRKGSADTGHSCWACPSSKDRGGVEPELCKDCCCLQAEAEAQTRRPEEERSQSFQGKRKRISDSEAERGRTETVRCCPAGEVGTCKEAEEADENREVTTSVPKEKREDLPEPPAGLATSEPDKGETITEEGVRTKRRVPRNYKEDGDGREEDGGYSARVPHREEKSKEQQDEEARHVMAPWCGQEGDQKEHEGKNISNRTESMLSRTIGGKKEDELFLTSSDIHTKNECGSAIPLSEYDRALTVEGAPRERANGRAADTAWLKDWQYQCTEEEAAYQQRQDHLPCRQAVPLGRPVGSAGVVWQASQLNQNLAFSHRDRELADKSHHEETAIHVDTTGQALPVSARHARDGGREQGRQSIEERPKKEDGDSPIAEGLGSRGKKEEGNPERHQLQDEVTTQGGRDCQHRPEPCIGERKENEGNDEEYKKACRRQGEVATRRKDQGDRRSRRGECHEGERATKNTDEQEDLQYLAGETREAERDPENSEQQPLEEYVGRGACYSKTSEKATNDSGAAGGEFQEEKNNDTRSPVAVKAGTEPEVHQRREKEESPANEAEGDLKREAEVEQRSEGEGTESGVNCMKDEGAWGRAAGGTGGPADPLANNRTAGGEHLGLPTEKKQLELERVRERGLGEKSKISRKLVSVFMQREDSHAGHKHLTASTQCSFKKFVPRVNRAGSPARKEADNFTEELEKTLWELERYCVALQNEVPRPLSSPPTSSLSRPSVRWLTPSSSLFSKSLPSKSVSPSPPAKSSLVEEEPERKGHENKDDSKGCKQRETHLEAKEAADNRLSKAAEKAGPTKGDPGNCGKERALGLSERSYLCSRPVFAFGYQLALQYCLQLRSSSW
ncbi:hypothetical protein CSUI_003916 [Cystoisospora suis]|uniref:Uncharacterized protein n=1 Tax=Cystoisospora suis TaxID=483139 RepID=A0A2C6KE00_9APIC|nr:hypothetical protein CSUI_003916 [Cystoisospora suis]